MNIENQVVNRPAIGVPPFKFVVAHSTGNMKATVQNEADYVNRAWQETEAYYTHVVGNGRAIQVNPVGQGSWNIGTYDTNVNTYAAVELIESATMDDYKIYVQLLHDLAVEAGLPLTLNNGQNGGIITHAYASRNGFGSDHTDPEAVLSRLGISQEQFASDLGAGFSDVSTRPQPSTPATGVDQVLNVGDTFSFTNQIYRVDAVSNERDEVISYELAGDSNATWDNNGVPASIVDEVQAGTLNTDGQDQVLQVGSWFKFKQTEPWTVIKVDAASNGVKFDVGNGETMWADATSLVEI